MGVCPALGNTNGVMARFEDTPDISADELPDGWAVLRVRPTVIESRWGKFVRVGPV